MTNLNVDDVYPPNRVIVREVGLRDGLQLVKRYPSTEAKEKWIEIEYQAGLRHFEAGSYLPAATFPQFVDVDVLVNKIAELPGAFSSVLALNKKGAIRALEGHAHEITCVVSASEEHNLRNARRSREEGLRELREIIALRDASERKPLISIGIAMGFGCSISGAVPIPEVLRIAERAVECGVDVIGVADTVGYGGPRQVTELTRELLKIAGKIPLLMHFHDTRGLGVANVAAALDGGARIFDASIGGLGGCPFAPGASGNVVLEDVIFLCQSMGFDMGIDLRALLPVREILAREMPDEPLYGMVAKAGLPLNFNPDAADHAASHIF